jgi:predicted RNA-binding protein YlxR (DUF448 family)
MARPRHIPMRRCAACREERAKRDLIRLVRVNLDCYALDLAQRSAGRGTSICLACARAALAKDDPTRLRGFRRAFRNHADAVTQLLEPLHASLTVTFNQPAGDLPVTDPTLSVSPAQPTAHGAASRPNGGMHG